MDLYISVSDQIQAKAKSTPFNYDEDLLARYKAIFEDKLFTRNYEHLQVELMRWQVQRWLWDFLCIFHLLSAESVALMLDSPR